MKRTAIYVRVSTRQQDTASQLADLKSWAEDRCAGIPVDWYEDTFSGTTMERPDWRRLEKEFRAGKISQLVCWRLDRLGRTASGLTQLFDELCERGINLISLKDGIDLTTPAGRLMANVIASVAQYETEIRRERVLAGQAAARAAGRTWGGSQLGVRKKVTSTQIKMIHRMKDEGETISAIAKAVALSRPTVYEILRTTEVARC